MSLIWFNKNISIDDIKDFGKETMANHLEMQWVEIGEDFLKLSMPVNEKTRQPYGLLHGGASCALAETVGSVASALVIDRGKFISNPTQINFPLSITNADATLPTVSANAQEAPPCNNP